MNTIACRIVAIYSIFMLNIAVLSIKCPSLPTEWCKTKEIAVACGVCTNIIRI